jgi:hypothetical protein
VKKQVLGTLWVFLLLPVLGMANDVSLLMERLQEEMAQTETDLRGGKDGIKTQTHLLELKNEFGRLADLYSDRYGGNSDLWRQACDRAQSHLEQARLLVADQQWMAARTAFQQVREIQTEAHDAFRPGLLKKIARLFQRKKTKKGESQ